MAPVSTVTSTCWAVVVLTREPSEEIRFIHDRMPLMLREKDVDEWISPDAKPDEVAYRAVTDLHFEKGR